MQTDDPNKKDNPNNVSIEYSVGIVANKCTHFQCSLKGNRPNFCSFLTGFVEVCIMHPLDLVKTRLQLQKKTSTLKSSDVHIYNGVGDCFAKMYRHEGFLAFYKGIVPPILVETPKRAVKVSMSFFDFFFII